MKFDVVVGNPPYQSVTAGNDPNSKRVSGKRNLYDKFLFLVMELTTSHWSLIVPSFWLGRPTHKLYKTVLPFCSHAINTTPFFDIVGVDTCALIGMMNRQQKISIVDGAIVHSGLTIKLWVLWMLI